LISRFNASLSAYLNDPRFRRHRTKASVAIAIAAAAAGIGATGASAGTSPWSAAASNLAAADSAAGHQGNIFGSVAGANDSVAGANDSVVDADAIAKTAHGSAKHAAAPAAPAAPANTSNPAKAARPAAPTAQSPVKTPVKAPAAKKAAGISNQISSSIVGLLQPFPAPRSVAQHPAGSKAPKRVAAPVKKAAPAHAVVVSHPASPATPATPYSIYDSVNPAAIPSGEQQVAVYANGSYQASWADVNGRRSALWIDTTGTNPGCDALDVEPGDATPSGAASWVKARLTQQPGSTAIVYTMRSEWQSVKDAVDGLPKAMQSKVKYWIADPTGAKHMVAGADATQWYWGTNYDITTANPGF
jgi:hypothetical protein